MKKVLKMNKKRALILLICPLILLVACATEPSDPEYGAGPDDIPTGGSVCETEISAPDSLRYGEQGEEISASCSCGRKVYISSVNSKVLEIQNNVARAVDLRENPLSPWPGENVTGSYIVAYHSEDGEGGAVLLSEKFVRLDKGRYSNVTHNKVSATYQSEPLLLENFKFVDYPISAEPGEHSFDAVYNADPAHYEDFVLKISVEVTKKDAVTAVHPTINTTFREGLTLGDLSLNDGFYWKDPFTELHASEDGAESFDAYYVADGFTEAFELKIPVWVEKGVYGEKVYPKELDCAYDEALTLSKISLEENFSWANPNETPTVSKRVYQAYFDAGKDYFPVELEIVLNVAPKIADPVIFPSLPEEMAFVSLPISSMLGQEYKDFRVENDGILHAQEDAYEVVVVWQKNENYAEQRKSFFIKILKATRDSVPSVPSLIYDEEASIYVIKYKLNEPELEYSLDGIVWQSENYFESMPEKIYYRFKETQDFLASEAMFFEPKKEQSTL